MFRALSRALITTFAALVSFSAQAQAAPGVMALRPPGPPITPASTSHVDYYGGPILANVKVYSVGWGHSVDATTQQRLGDFYAAFTSSAMFDWLSEYSTAHVRPVVGSQGTSQILGRGTFGGWFTIAPSTVGAAVDDAQIRSELQAQIAAQALPAPDANSVYMIHFPPGVTIAYQGLASCQQFCAYHSAFTPPGAVGVPVGTTPPLVYAVLPDFNPPSACAIGCGAAATTFDAVTSVASRELLGAVTDPDVGLASGQAPPLAWYDPQGSNGEIGDICNGTQASFRGASGTVYAVQKAWSNVSKACIGVSGADAFSVAVSPVTRTVFANASTSYVVTTSVIRGAAQTVTLSTTGLPSGVVGSFNPPSLTTGSSAALTLAASGQAVSGLTAFTVTGTATGSTSSTGAQVIVVGGSTGNGGGKCPPGTVEVGGVCVPAGCAVGRALAGAGAGRGGWGSAAILTFWLGVILRRRSRRKTS